MSNARPTIAYSIQLGHARVTVHGDSPDDALHKAREQLSLEYPRLWDAIHEADNEQFRIDRAA